MELIPVRTRVLHPPKDDLLQVLDTSLTDVRNGDVIIVTSKVVAIHEGRCVPIEGTDKERLVRNEAELLYLPPWREKPITIVRNAFILTAGIDESNGGGYYILLPEDAFKSAREIHAYLTRKFNVTELGIIITDSHSLPFRYGAMSVSIGCWGLEPIVNHIGRPDLFGRITQYSKTNIPDTIAAAATLVSGECDEAQPIQVLRGVPNLVFTNTDPREAFFVPYEDDIYRDLYRDFKRPSAQA